MKKKTTPKARVLTPEEKKVLTYNTLNSLTVASSWGAFNDMLDDDQKKMISNTSLLSYALENAKNEEVFQKSFAQIDWQNVPTATEMLVSSLNKKAISLAQIDWLNLPTQNIRDNDSFHPLYNVSSGRTWIEKTLIEEGFVNYFTQASHVLARSSYNKPLKMPERAVAVFVDALSEKGLITPQTTILSSCLGSPRSVRLVDVALAHKAERSLPYLIRFHSISTPAQAEDTLLALAMGGNLFDKALTLSEIKTDIIPNIISAKPDWHKKIAFSKNLFYIESLKDMQEFISAQRNALENASKGKSKKTAFDLFNQSVEISLGGIFACSITASGSKEKNHNCLDLVDYFWSSFSSWSKEQQLGVFQEWKEFVLLEQKQSYRWSPKEMQVFLKSFSMAAHPEIQPHLAQMCWDSMHIMAGKVKKITDLEGEALDFLSFAKNKNFHGVVSQEKSIAFLQTLLDSYAEKDFYFREPENKSLIAFLKGLEGLDGVFQSPEIRENFVGVVKTFRDLISGGAHQADRDKGVKMLAATVPEQFLAASRPAKKM